MSIVRRMLLAVLGALPGITTAQEEGDWLPTDDSLRILEIRYSKYTFDDLLGAYQYEDVVLLPVGELAALVDIGVEVEEGVASGFVIREEQTLILDARRHEIVLAGETSTYDPDLVKELLGEIYVESELLGRWFGMSFDINLFSSVLTIRSPVKLPFLARIEREERIRKQEGRQRLERVYYPRHREPYRLLSVPFIDQSLSLGHVGGGDPAVGSPLNWSYTTYLTADFLNLETQLFLSGQTADSVEDFRVTFGRKDPSGGMLKFLGANQYQFGNVTEPRVDLITRTSGFERGVSVGNFPLSRQEEYDRHRFQGELLPDWEVELYHNNRLLKYQADPADGRYDFSEIPLLYGDNYYRLVFYGPQGQLREETRRFQLNESLTRRGEFYYNLSATRDETSGHRLQFLADYGFARNLSASVSFVSIPLHTEERSEQHHYVRSALSASMRSFFVNVSAIADNGKGSLYEVDTQGRLGNSMVRLNHMRLNDFVSEEFHADQRRVVTRSMASWNTALSFARLPWLPRIPVGFELETDRFSNGDTTTESRMYQSMSVKGVALNHQVSTLRSSGLTTQTTGVLNASFRWRRAQFRSAVTYQTRPDSQISSATVSINPGAYGDYHVNYGITRSLGQGITEFTAAVRKQSKQYALSLVASYNSAGETQFELNFSVGFGHEPREQRWRANANSVANLGSLSTRVFLDENQDGVFGGSDEPLENVGFLLNGGHSRLLTDGNGISFLTGLPAAKPLDLVVETSSLEDPSWTAALKGVQVVPRPGRTIQLDFPIFLSGEIDGTVYGDQGGQRLGLTRVQVELVDEFDRVLQTVETAYDGFYIVTGVPLGSYRVRVAGEQLEGTELRLARVEQVTVDPDNLFVSGIDLDLVGAEESMVAELAEAQPQPGRPAPLPEPIAPQAYTDLLSKTLFFFGDAAMLRSAHPEVRRNAIFDFR